MDEQRKGAMISLTGRPFVVTINSDIAFECCVIAASPMEAVRCVLATLNDPSPKFSYVAVRALNSIITADAAYLQPPPQTQPASPEGQERAPQEPTT